MPELPRSGYPRHVQGLSPSSRLDGSLVRSGLVSSRSRPWGFTLQGFLPLQSRDTSRCPLPSWCLPGVVRARRFTGSRGFELRTSQSPTPRGVGAKRLWAPARTDRVTLASRDLSGWSLAGPLPPDVRGWRTPTVPDAERRRVHLQGLDPCKELGPLGRLLGRDRGRCPLGLLPLQGSLARTGGRPFPAALPSRTFPATSVANHGAAVGPSGVFPMTRLDAPLARCVGPHEVSHLFTPGSRFDHHATSG